MIWCEGGEVNVRRPDLDLMNMDATRLGQWSITDTRVHDVEAADMARGALVSGARVTIRFHHVGRGWTGDAYVVAATRDGTFTFIGTGAPRAGC
jgi:hypothetical protein